MKSIIVVIDQLFADYLSYRKLINMPVPKIVKVFSWIEFVSHKNIRAFESSKEKCQLFLIVGESLKMHSTCHHGFSRIALVYHFLFIFWRSLHYGRNTLSLLTHLTCLDSLNYSSILF